MSIYMIGYGVCLAYMLGYVHDKSKRFGPWERVAWTLLMMLVSFAWPMVLGIELYDHGPGRKP